MNDELVNDFDLEDDSFNDDDEEIEEFVDETYNDFDTNFQESASTYKLWLDTEPYLNQIYLSITNQKIEKIRIVKQGKISYKNKPVPITKHIKPLANDLGISQIMGLCRTFLSSPLVQGNFDKDDYHKIMYSLSIKINRAVFTNRINWGIKVQDLGTILTMIEESIGIFLTRTINNLERSRDKYNPNRETETRNNGFFDKFNTRRKKRLGVAQR